MPKKVNKGMVRWFFISNWGRLYPFGPQCEYKCAQDYINFVCGTVYDNERFRGKAVFEVVQGTEAYYLNAQGESVPYPN